MNIVIYKRVSTQRQGVSGLGLEAQETIIQNYLKTQPAVQTLASFTEVETGTAKRKRPMLQEALKICKDQNATLVVASLSRLARNVHFISGLVASNVSFVALDMPSMDKTMAYFMAIMAEWEADAISKRTKDALAALKARGVKLGPKYKPLTAATSEPYRKALNLKKQQKAFEFADRMLPTLDFYKNQGYTQLRIAQELNAKGYATPSGQGKWSATTVNRVYSRAIGGSNHG